MATTTQRPPSNFLKKSAMNIPGTITFNADSDSTTIEIGDKNASIVFAKTTLSNDQLCQMLSKRYQVECNVSVSGLDKIGSKLHTATVTIPVADDFIHRSKQELYTSNYIRSKLDDLGYKEWVPDVSFKFITGGPGTMKSIIVTIRKWEKS